MILLACTSFPSACRSPPGSPLTSAVMSMRAKRAVMVSSAGWSGTAGAVPWAARTDPIANANPTMHHELNGGCDMRAVISI